MASFTFSEIPSEIAERIMILLGSGGFRNLIPWIRVGKVGKEVELSAEVLRTLPMTEFLFQPNMKREDAVSRNFFHRCVEASNPDVKYLEGIRLVCQMRQLHDGLRLLGTIRPREPHHSFTASIFLICKGEFDRGFVIILRMERTVPEFEILNLLADQFLEFVGEMKIRLEYNIVRWSLSALMDHVHACVDHGACFYDNRCRNCYVYWVCRQVDNWV